MKKHALLIIDAQYDFCHPNGSLYVNGAQEDMARLKNWIIKNAKSLDHICLTMDSHPVLHIAHPLFWYNDSHQNPAPFTVIRAEDVQSGKWSPIMEKDLVISYLEELEKQGQFPHVIWPQHCITGSLGFSLDNQIVEAIVHWCSLRNYHQVVMKGSNPLTEHFGIFSANIPLENQPDTQPNYHLLNQLNEFENLWLAGEAKSHCVATSLNQMMELKPQLAKKVIVISDCMSDVQGLGHLGEPIYEKAKQFGVRFMTSESVIS